ncbi:MAG: carboxy terminal-processing peptidase [bacterium]
MKKLIAILLLFVFLGGNTGVAEEDKLNQAVVRGIVERFTSLHYAQEPLNDELSKRIFQLYLDSLDSGHYYFLESDVKEFRAKETSLDDMLRRGDVTWAMDVFTRFLTRLSQRQAMLESFLEDEFDFEKDGQWRIDRKDEPYPKNEDEAQETWRLKTKFDLLTLKLAGNTDQEAKDRLLKRIRSIWKDYSQYTDDDVIALYLNALTRAYDPHSTYMAAEDLRNFDISIKLSLDGIGAVLRWEDGYTVVNSIIPGGAAARHGKLAVDDRIIAVAQGTEPFESVIDMRLNDVVELIRGQRGTTVRLQVMRKNENGFDTLNFAIVRDKIILKDGEAKAEIFEPTASTEESPSAYRIGVIELPSFYVDFNDRRQNPNNYKSSSRDVRAHLEQFKRDGVDGVILDLRNNGGGGLDEAITMAGLFVGRKPIVIVRQASGARITVHRSREEAIYEGPLLVMLNRFSASASEILAGAMHDYQRAILVGDRTTFGKGTVQNIVQLPEGYGALKVTIAQFYRVSGWSTQNRGVETDMILPSINNARDLGESTLENALPWKAISPISYTPVGNIRRYINELQQYSSERLSKDTDFKEIEENVQEFLTNVKPLEYTSILKMQEDAAKRKEERDEEMASARKTMENTTQEDSEEVTASNEETTIRSDAYLLESMAILEDYIRLQQRVEVKN